MYAQGTTDTKCKKKVIKKVPNDFRCPQYCVDILECHFNYKLKMDLEDDIGKLVKVVVF